MQGLFGTDSTQASSFGCIRPGSVNRFMLHVAAYVVHCQLPGSDATLCSLFSFTGDNGTRRCMARMA